LAQVKVANPNATDAEVAQAVEAGGANVFADQVLFQKKKCQNEKCKKKKRQMSSLIIVPKKIV
jgi:t-SNARE complex subunit (syntaxin)